MSSLVDIAQRSSIEEVISYAQSVIDSSVRSLGITVSTYTPTGEISHKLSGYDKDKTVFALAQDGNRLFALVRDNVGDKLTLYSNGFNEKNVPSANNNIVTGISSYRFVENHIVYFKDDIQKNTGDIFAYNGDKTVKISNAASSFKVANESDIIILKNYNNASEAPTADFYLFVDSKEKSVEKDIIADSVIVSPNGNAVYLVGEKNVLEVYSKGKTSTVVDGVEKILFFE